MQKCLILGGDGFLGNHLVDDLLGKGYDIRVFGRFKNGKVKNLDHVKNHIEIFSGEFLNAQDLEKALKNIDYVFHFISSSNPASSINRLRQEIEFNVLPAIQLLDICVKKKIKKIIFPSSGGSIYGHYSKGRAHEEDKIHPISPHALGKSIIEQFFHYHKIRHALDYIIYRISNVYGERKSAHKSQGVIPIILSKALKNETIEIYGNTTRDFIYVKDVTSFIADNFVKSHRYNLYNLGSGKGVKLLTLLKLIERQTGLKLNIKKLKKRNFDVDRIVLDIGRIKDEFNFSLQTPLPEGIKKTYNYLLQ